MLKKSLEVLLIYVVFFCSKTLAFAQSNDFKWYNDDNGLPQNSVKSIGADKHGFIWLTTENGLVRFDGQQFKVYNSANTHLKSNRLLYFAGNPVNDSIYTTTEGADDLILIHKGTVRTISKNLLHKTSIYSDSSFGNFLAHGNSMGFTQGQKHSTTFKRTSGGSFYYESGSLSSISANGTKIWSIALPYDYFLSSFMLGDRFGYVDKKRTVHLLSAEQIKQSISIGREVTGKFKIIWNAVNQQVFVLTNEGIMEIENIDVPKLKQIYAFRIGAFDISKIQTIFLNKQHQTLYVGTASMGLGELKLVKFKTYTPENSPDSPYQIFYAINQIDTNTVVSSSGYVIKNGIISKDYNFTDNQRTLIKDLNDNFYAIGSDGLSVFKKSEKYFRRHLIFRSNECTAIALNENELYFTTIQANKNESILYKKTLSNLEQTEKIITFKGLASQLKLGDSKTILITTSLGVKKINLTNRKVYLIKNTEKLNVREIVFENANNIWLFSYGNGFRLLKDNKLYAFPIDLKRSLLTAHTFVEDQFGYLWIPTNKGLFQVEKSRLLEKIEQRNLTVYYYMYQKQDGFLTNEFNGGCIPLGVKTSNGNIYFPSLNGVVEVNPTINKPEFTKYDIFLDEVVVDGISKPIQKKVSVPRNFERLTLKVTSPFYGSNENLVLEAKFSSNKHSKWIRVNPDGTISYTNLGPGTHKLIIRKLESLNGLYRYKTIDINVDYAFYDTLAFKLFLLAGIAALLFGVYFGRLSYISKQNAFLEGRVIEKTNHLQDTISTLRSAAHNLNSQISSNKKIIQYLTHDLRSPLRFMAMLSKDLIDNSKDITPERQESLFAIYESSNQMFAFIDNLLDYSQVADDTNLHTKIINVKQLIQSKINLFKPIALNQKTVLINEINDDLTISANLILLRIVLHNLLDNAIKFSPGKSVRIRQTSSNHFTTIAIEDSGKGMSQELVDYYNALSRNFNENVGNTNRGLGLQIVIELMMILNGQIQFSSSSKGTIVQLTFKNKP